MLSQELHQTLESCRLVFGAAYISRKRLHPIECKGITRLCCEDCSMIGLMASELEKLRLLIENNTCNPRSVCLG